MSTVTTISKGNVTAAIDSMGAQLSSLKVNGNEYLWQADPAFWGKHAPVLFPIVGALKDGSAASAAGECTMARHGIARIVEHRLVGVSEDGAAATYELTESEESLKAYPYRFKLNMTYAITGPATLTQTFAVTNTGDVDMPFSVGGHPAFNVPVPGAEDEAFEDYELAFTEPWTCKVPTMVDGGLMTFDETFDVPEASDTYPLTHETFECDTIMLTDVPGSTLTLRGRKSGHGIKMDFEGFKFIGIWSPGTAPFIALEPWTGHTGLTSEDGTMEGKDNVTILAPGATDTRSFKITLI